MATTEDKNTRYFIDLDLETREILVWGYGQRGQLKQKLQSPFHHRVFISKGQYNKLEQKYLDQLNKI